MKRRIQLTERDLTKMVKKALNEYFFFNDNSDSNKEMGIQEAINQCFITPLVSFIKEKNPKYQVSDEHWIKYIQGWIIDGYNDNMKREYGNGDRDTTINKNVINEAVRKTLNEFFTMGKPQTIEEAVDACNFKPLVAFLKKNNPNYNSPDEHWLKYIQNWIIKGYNRNMGIEQGRVW